MRRSIESLVIVATVLALAACGGAAPEADELASDGEALSVPAPAISGQPGSTDIADRGCEVVLRDVHRSLLPTGVPETKCVGRSCHYVWLGTMDVAEDWLAQGAVPGLLYKASTSRTWNEVTPVATTGGTGGMRRFSSRLDANTLVPPAKGKKLTASLQVTALVHLQGKRFFDRNRAVTDQDIDKLTPAAFWTLTTAPDLCAPHVAEKAVLTFDAGWTQAQHGAIVPGGKLEVQYDLNRLPQCMGSTYNGLSAWTTTAAIRFTPGGQEFDGPVKGWNMGSDPTSFFSSPYAVTVPPDATGVEIWFYTSGAHCSGTFYDSNMGQNYRFAVQPAAPAAVTWAGQWGGSLDRACGRNEGLPEPIVVDEYLLERACVDVEADVFVPGLTDAGEHPEFLAAQAEYWLPGQTAAQTAWLTYQGRVGNNYRFRWTPDRNVLRNNNVAGDITWDLRFSTNGLDWFRIGQGDGPVGGAKRTFRRTP